MGRGSRRASLALPAVLLLGLLAFAAARPRVPLPDVPSPSIEEDVPAPRPRVTRAYSGPVDGLRVEALEGLDERQRAAARKAVEEARRRLDARAGSAR